MLIFPLQNLFRVGSGNSNTLKKYKFSFGSPCTIGRLLINIWFFLAQKLITVVLSAILLKPLSISYKIALRLKWSGVNPGCLAPIIFSTTTSNLASNKRHIGYSNPSSLASLEDLLPLPLLALMV